MNKIPTAEQLATEMFIKHPDSYSNFNRVSFTGKQLKEVAIALSKLHVEAALESANKLVDNSREYIEDKNFIINSYPLTNIK